jgi:hypothetical protein
MVDHFFALINRALVSAPLKIILGSQLSGLRMKRLEVSLVVDLDAT